MHAGFQTEEPAEGIFAPHPEYPPGRVKGLAGIGDADSLLVPGEKAPFPNLPLTALSGGTTLIALKVERPGPIW